MRGRSTTVGIILVITLLVTADVEAIEIFVWDHNNDIEIRDLVFGEDLNVFESMIRTLDSLGLEYTSNDRLPGNLDGYDLVIINLGAHGCG